MTDLNLTLESGAVSRRLRRLADALDSRRTRRARLRSYAMIPESLRQDVGLDGGAPLGPLPLPQHNWTW